jgi:hypothetical protein
VNSVLRPMSTSEILDRTFSLYRNNFFVFAGIAILPAALGLALHVVGIATHLTVRTAGRSPGQTQLTSLAFELLVVFVASIVGGAIATGATVYGVYYLHLGKPATITGSYKNVLAAWFRVIAAAVLVFLAVLLVSGVVLTGLAFAVFLPLSNKEGLIAGFAVLGVMLLLFLLWLYLSAWLSFVIPALLLDKNSIFRSFRRSHRLSKGSRGRIFLVLLLTLILTLAFTWAMRIPAYMIFDQRRQEIPLQLWSDIAQFLSAVIAGPIATIAIALFYIDQRIRQEAFDLHLMLQSIQENASSEATKVPSTVG